MCHLLLEDRDGLAVNNQFSAVKLDFSLVAAMGGVILEHVHLK